MSSINNDIKPGNGVYSITDIAFILRLPQRKVKRWMYDFWDSRLGKKYNAKYSRGEGRNKTTNFYTLIEFYVFYQLREKKVSVKKNLEAHEQIAVQLKTCYPFASAEVLTDGKSIIYSLEDGTIVNADKSRQILLREIISEFCQKIEFSESKLAERYYPLGKEYPIMVDPHHQFGQPVIEKTNILAETIYYMFKAGESKKVIGNLYELNAEEVDAAIEFCKKAA